MLKADSIATKLEHYSVLRDVAEILWQIEERQKNYEKALETHQKYKAYSDSILNTETVKKILKVRVNYELAEREKEEAQRMMVVELKAKQQRHRCDGI